MLPENCPGDTHSPGHRAWHGHGSYACSLCGHPGEKAQQQNKDQTLKML